MSSLKPSKINLLLRNWQRGSYGVQEWLDSLGISRQLANRYCETQWLQRISAGVYKIIGDEVDWLGGIYTLQQQLKFKIHIGALSALELQGYGHYVILGDNRVIWILKSSDEPRLLPLWFVKLFGKKNKVFYLTRNLFKQAELGLISHSTKNFDITISTPERAMIESTVLTPNQFSLEHTKLLMENMSTLRPNLVQQLLESCTSVKAKRLFMLLAEYCGHQWVQRLDLSKIDFGQGKRVLGTGGHYYSKYKLSLSINLNEHEGYQIDEERL